MTTSGRSSRSSRTAASCRRKHGQRGRPWRRTTSAAVVGHASVAPNGRRPLVLSRSRLPRDPSALATFTIPSVFPPLDEEGLYILRRPFMMPGTWTVHENTISRRYRRARSRVPGPAGGFLDRQLEDFRRRQRMPLHTGTPTLVLLAVAGGITLIARARTRADRVSL